MTTYLELLAALSILGFGVGFLSKLAWNLYRTGQRQR